MRYLLLCIFPLASIITSAMVWAQSPKPIELMPSSTVFYAEGIDSPTLMQLPFVDNILQSTLFRQLWKTPDAMKLRGGITLAEVALGERLQEALGKLTGQGWSVGIDSQSKGVVLWAHARDAAACEELTKKLIAVADNDAKSKGHELKHVSYRNVDAYEINKVIVARMDDYLVVTNQGELAKRLVDRWREAPAQADTLAGNKRFQDFVRPVPPEVPGKSKPLARAWVDLQQLREAGLAKILLEGPHDNFPAELLLGGAIAILRGAPTLEASLIADDKLLNLRLDMPITKSAHTERYEYFFGQNISGQAPPLIDLSGSQANVCLYRDIAQLWQRAGDLFGQKTNDQLAQAETTLTTLFSGRDFANDILGSIRPELQLIVTEQEFGKAGAPVPQIKLPAFALVTRLRDPQVMQPQMKRIFMSFIGFINVTGAQNQQPQLDLEAFRLESGWEVTATYAIEADRPKDWIVPVQYNFSPTLTMIGDYAVIASTKHLARSITEKLSATPAKATAGSDAHLNSLVRVDGDLVNRALLANRQQLISQNMIEKGHSPEEAAAEIDLLLQAIKLIKSLNAAFTVGSKATLDLHLEMAKADLE